MNSVRKVTLQISLIFGITNRRQLDSHSVCCDITDVASGKCNCNTWAANNFLKLRNFDPTDLLKGSPDPRSPRPYFENCYCLVHEEMGQMKEKIDTNGAKNNVLTPVIIKY